MPYYFDANGRYESKDTLIRLLDHARAIGTYDQIAVIEEPFPEHGVPCFCADLTVNPILVDWNKMVAARLAPFPGFDVGLLETNGHQNYANWEEMESYHPCTDAPWREVRNGVFDLGEHFYVTDGCIFRPSEHYEKMFAG